MKNIIFLFSFCLIILFFSCGTSGDSNKAVSTIKVKYNVHHQTIDGFGGSDAWTSLPRDRETANELVTLLFSKTEGAGFTILRNRIPFRERLPGDDMPNLNDGFIIRKSDHTYDYTLNRNGIKTFNLNWNSWDLSGTRNLIKAINDLGSDGPEQLTIMSTPWTPPNNRVTRWKEDIIGEGLRYNYVMDWSRPDWWGRLKRQHYNDYADLLADYVVNFENNMGHPLSILSVQNEPNWKVQYESAYWNGIDLRDFIKVIGSRFPMKNIFLGEGGLGIMMPEFENFDINFNEMIKPSLDDKESEKIITHIALHQYNGAYDTSPRAGAKAFPQIISSGKRFWQTEVSGTGNQIPSGIGIANALYFARMIHFDFTLSEVNAFLFWWLWTNNSDDTSGSLIINDNDDLIITDRFYVMSQYSRFIRPGWTRIGCDTSVRTGTYSSAYANLQTKEISIVIVNDRYSSFSVNIDLEDAEFVTLENWRTTDKEKMKNNGLQETYGNSTLVRLPPMSVTTLYGRVK